MNKISSIIRKNSKLIFVIALTIAGSIALAGVFVMTDFGQLFAIKKQFVVSYFRHHMFFMTLSFLTLILAILINIKEKIMKRWIIIVLSSMWLTAILSTKYVAPYLLFRTHQYNAEFISTVDADGYLTDDDVVFVIDLNGVQKAYPRNRIWQTHIVGGDFNGDNVLFTYCVLTNLPTAYINQPGEDAMEFKVLAQTNNNLLIWETHSGEIIQQINHTCEFSNKKLKPLPVLEMSWAGYKKLYPKGTVFYNEFDTPMEKILYNMLSLDDTWYGDKWMFKTVNLKDTRLHSKEQVIGLKDKDKQVAITKTFIKEKKILNIKVGDKYIALAYFPQLDAIAAFNRFKNGKELNIDTINFQGNTPQYGKLEREFIYNSVLWAVWAHYYPKTKLLK